jgi:hypothetical protein
MPTRAVNRQTSKQTLPRFLKPYFWDTDHAKVNARRHAVYIIERVLEYGDDRAIRWLQKNYSPEQIARVVRTSRVLSPNTANLWGLLLHIPRHEIRCFSKPSLLPRSAFSHS